MTHEWRINPLAYQSHTPLVVSFVSFVVIFVYFD